MTKGRQHVRQQTTTKKHDLAVFRSLLSLIPFFLSSVVVVSVSSFFLVIVKTKMLKYVKTVDAISRPATMFKITRAV